MGPHRPRILLTSILDRRNPVLDIARELVERFPPATFESVDESASADVVLYLEHGYVGLTDLPRLLRSIRRHPGAKHFLYSESDWPYAVLPGAYPSLTAPRSWACSWSYISAAARPDPVATNEDGSPAPDLLFSFLGRASTHPIRSDVIRLNSPTTPCVDIADAPGRFPSFDYTETYWSLLRRSRFVLCPRGIGTSSIRIFETMAAGRVPVIISDAWQPPPAVDWAECSVRVAERNIGDIPAILARAEAHAPLMGARASAIYAERFAAPVFLDRLSSTLLESYSHCAINDGAILSRAVRTLSARELRTLAHVAWTRSVARGGG